MHHHITEYSTEKGIPLCLHQNRFFKMIFNGYFHYLEPVKYAKGVLIVPRFSNGDFLLVRLQRVPSVGLSIEFPRGGVEPDEPLELAAVRELSEETGYDLSADSVMSLGRLAAETATVNGLMDVFAVHIPDTAQMGEFDTEEIDKPMRVSEAEFKRMIIAGEIVDGMTLAAYSMLLVRT